MKVWSWTDNLTRGLKRLAEIEKADYQSMHAYADGHDDLVKSEVDSATAEIPAAVSVANSAASAVNSAVAASKVNSQAIDNMKSAAAQIKADASDAVKQAQSAIASVDSQAKAIESQISSVQSAVGSDQKANQAAISAVRSDAQAAQNTISDVAKNLDTVSNNLDTYAKAAAEQGHDITDIKKQQGLLQAGIADVKGNVAQLTATTNSLDAAIKDNKGNISDLSDKANQLSFDIKNAQSDVASVIAKANQLQSTVENQNKQITNAMQTASAASVTASDAKSNAAQAAITASNASVTVGDMKNDVVNVSATASQAQLTATNAQSQAMKATATASDFSAQIAGVETKADSAASAASDASKKAESAGSQVSQVAEQVTTNTADIEANQKAIAGKVDQASFDKTNQKVSDLSGQVNIVAGQVSAKASQTDIDKLKKTVNSQAGEIQANANGLLLKADKSVTDALNQSYQSQAAQQQVLANEINTKVSAADVEKTIDGKGFATKSMVETTTKEQADQLSATITQLHNDDVDQMTHLQASIDGVQNTVNNKADQSTVTQLADTFQVKLEGKSLCSNPINEVRWSGKENEYIPIADLHGINGITAGTQVTLSFKYQSLSGDVNFLPQFNNDPWIPFGDVNSGAVHAKNNVVGYYCKTITVTDDSWKNGKATQLCVRCDNFNGMIVFYNIKLTAGDSVSSELDMLNNDMNLRVKKGDLVSQINQEAGGNTLIQVANGKGKLYLDADSTVFSNKAFIPSAAIINLDADKINTGTLNGVHIHQIKSEKGRTIDIADGNITMSSNDPYEARLTFNYQGKATKMFNSVGDIECNSLMLFNFKPSDTQSLHPISFFNVINTDGSGSGKTNIQFDGSVIDGHEWWTNSDGVTFGKTYDGAHGSSTYVNVYAQSFAPHSQLSAKTRIEKLDGHDALKAIMQDNMYTYQFKSDVAAGKTKRYASLIIDDVHDVAQYTEPDIFLADDHKCRDDGTQLAYLIAAVQYQQKMIEDLQKRVTKLEGK